MGTTEDLGLIIVELDRITNIRQEKIQHVDPKRDRLCEPELFKEKVIEDKSIDMLTRYEDSEILDYLIAKATLGWERAKQLLSSIGYTTIMLMSSHAGQSFSSTDHEVRDKYLQRKTSLADMTNRNASIHRRHSAIAITREA